LAAGTPPLLLGSLSGPREHRRPLLAARAFGEEAVIMEAAARLPGLCRQGALPASARHLVISTILAAGAPKRQ